MSPMFFQVISMVGAAMILGAYVAYQRGRMGREDRSYNLLNFLGSGLLTWVAVVQGNYGFIVLEGAWALLSLWPILRPTTSARPAA